jgi:hypothetical protein
MVSSGCKRYGDLCHSVARARDHHYQSGFRPAFTAFALPKKNKKGERLLKNIKV